MVGKFGDSTYVQLFYDSQFIETNVVHKNITDDKVLDVFTYHLLEGQKRVIEAREFEGMKPKQQTKTITGIKGQGDIIFPYERIGDVIVPATNAYFLHRALHTEPNKEIRVPVVIEPLNASDKEVEYTVSTNVEGVKIGRDGVLRGLTETGQFANIGMRYKANEEFRDLCEVICTDKPYPITRFELKLDRELVVGEYHKMIFTYVPTYTAERDFDFTIDNEPADIKLINGGYAIKRDEAGKVTLKIVNRSRPSVTKEIEITFIEKE